MSSGDGLAGEDLVTLRPLVEDGGGVGISSGDGLVTLRLLVGDGGGVGISSSESSNLTTALGRPTFTFEVSVRRIFPERVLLDGKLSSSSLSNVTFLSGSGDAFPSALIVRPLLA